ncbi:MAG: C40 family peptidase [Duncaniella sp.]|nr:C40 family peptidase [Duncaniella sp.]
MNTVIKYILSIFAVAGCAAAMQAEPNIGNSMVLPIPSKHYTSTIDTSEALIKAAYERVREDSPFTALEAIEEETDNDSQLDLIGRMKSFAHDLLGRRYRLGASGPTQFDCSGFVGYVFRNFGFDLNRDSRSQYMQGERVEKGELKPGDLLFFSSRSSGKGRVGHVGMVTDVNPDGSCRFIHASSSKHGVVYQNFPDNGYYSKHYIGAKRIIGV